ncbi:MAG TPA: ABC transporter ATP-binding protein [Jiangellaceae bacterium]
MTLNIEVQDLTVRYGDVAALDELSLHCEGGKIHGLLGRNGAGKSTLLAALAAYRRPTSGRVLVGGENPFENPRLMPQICLIREALDVYDTETCRSVLSLGALRPTWDAEYAEELVEKFEIPVTRRSVTKLSRGTKAALACVIGLASRAPLTIFDESYLGMDAPSRAAFYDELLADYMRHPRTIVISTHLVEEFSGLFEQVAIIDSGRLVLQDETDEIRARGASVIGPAEVVDRVAGHAAVAERRLGPTKSVTVYGDLGADFEETVRAAGLELGPVSLQDLFIHLTANRSVKP